ncbi:acid protease [Hypoxylon crocopeplum]|nr:acid protease [Hypoxylon crocopeplum]
MELSSLLYYGLLVGKAQAASLPLHLNNATHDDGHMRMNATSFYKSSAQVLSLPLKRVEHSGVGTPSLARRYFGTDVLDVYGAAYFAELTIGTVDNPQVVDVLIDTGSFELWVDPDCAASNVQEFCEALGQYDPSQSSTAQDLSTAFSIQYGQGSTSGTYYTDDVYISGARIQNQQFGVSNASSDVWFGILGLGHGQGGGVIEYPSIVDSLASQGYTNSRLFSLDLGGQPGPTAAVTGEMVFGGVDTNKYAGTLAKVPTDPSDPHYVITLNSISLQTPTSDTNNTISRRQQPISDSNLPLQVVVDSGTTISLLPESLVTSLAAQFPGAQPDGNGGYTVPCELRDEDGSVTFELAGDGGAAVIITVSYADFIWNGGDDCVVGASYSGDIGLWILGDTFLRGAYVTFDQDNNALYMANYISCGNGSNLAPVPTGPDAAASIPGSCELPAPAPSAERVPSPSVNTPNGGDVPTTGAPSPDVFDPDCTDSIIPAPPAATIDREVPASSPVPDNDEDCDDDETGQQRVAQPPEEPITVTETFTSTIVRHVVYTTNDQRVTSYETVVTTFCPGDIIPPASPSPAPAPASGPAPSPPQLQTHVQTTRRPTTTPAVATPNLSPSTPNRLEVTRVAATVTELYTTTERCSTSTYAITSCDASNSVQACTVGATTTQVITILETLRVHAQAHSSPSLSLFPSPSSSSSLSPSPSPQPSFSQTLSQPPAQFHLSTSSTPVTYTTYYSHPLPPPPAQQSISAYAGLGTGWGFNISSSGLPVAGVAYAGGAPSRGPVGVVALPAVPVSTPTTTTRARVGLQGSPTRSGFAVPTSGARGIAVGGVGRLWIGVGVGMVVAVVVAVI